MINWQPISTAPLDGTDILVYDGYDVWKVYYDLTIDDIFDCKWCLSSIDPLWLPPPLHADVIRRPLFHEPTHWLPISDLLQPLGHL